MVGSLGHKRNTLKILCGFHYKVSPLLSKVFNGDFLPSIFLWKNAGWKVLSQALYVIAAMHVYLKPERWLENGFLGLSDTHLLLLESHSIV